jgi:hypothetical protein
MPYVRKEADINCCHAALAFRRGIGCDAAESRINVYAANTSEMCET